MNTKDILKDYPDGLTAQDLMEILKVSKTTLYRILDRGEIKSLKVGREHRVPKLYLIQYLYPDMQLIS